MIKSTVAVISITILVFAAGCTSTNDNEVYDDSSKHSDYPTYEEVVRFHGHTCPGSMMGYRMAIAGMNAVMAAGVDPNEIYAIVENNNCGVDALQVVSSCTFGKKRIIYHDYGKNVYTLFSPKTGRGFRVSLHLENIPDNVQKDREAFTKFLFEAPEDDFLIVSKTAVALEIPKHTRESVLCAICKERVNKNRTVVVEDKKTCIPCSR